MNVKPTFNNWYVVVITEDRYLIKSVHNNLSSAVVKQREWLNRHCCCVIRDGKTGEKLTIKDAEKRNTDD